MESPSPLTPIDPNVSSHHVQNKSQNIEKPLPPPPSAIDCTPSEGPQSGSPAPTQESPSHGARPSVTDMPSFQRSKKRVFVGKKIFTIALPLVNEQGENFNRDRPLKPEDVQKRLKDWESKGYDTRGFTLAVPSPKTTQFAPEGQSKPVHPDPEEELCEWSQRSYRVSVPDKRDWEAYVNHLKEEKLRALGVSSGDDEPPSRKSPAPSLMSRGASSQGSSMLLSPPLAPTSMGSLPFPSQFQGQPQLTGLPGKQAVSHFPRYSVVAPFEGKPIQSPNHFPPSRSPGNGTWSPQPFLSSQPNSRIGSPLANGPTQNMGNSFSPTPPMVKNSVPIGPPKDPGDLLAQMRQQQQALQAQQMHQQQQQQHAIQARLQNAPTAPRPVEIDIPIAEGVSRTHIVTPTPRGAIHRQNPSESLQREVEEAEAALEASAREDGISSDTMYEDKVEDLKDKISKTMKEMPPAQGAKPEKEPKPTAKEFNVPDEQQIGQAEVAPRERSRSSASKLNVNAPEFKIEPKQATSSGVFSFLGDSQPTPIFGIKGPSAPGHAKKPSIGATSKLNVAAPVFTPQSAPKPQIPSGEFSFSSQGPSFKPGTPAFNPSASVFKSSQPAKATGTGAEDKENPVQAVQKIFGDFKYAAEVIKPVKKSRALPILPPKVDLNEGSAKDDLQEDESGRLIRADARQKRARRDQDEGDQVPMFASPSGTPWLDDKQEDRAAYFGNSESSSTSENDEPTTLEAATELLEEILDATPPTSVAKTLLSKPKSLDAERKQGESFTFQDVDQAASFSVALPPEVDTEKKKIIDPSLADIAKATLDFPSHSPEYKPEYDDALERGISDISSISSPQAFEKKHSQPTIGDEKVDRVDHAHHSLPLRQDILNGVRYVEPTYDEIDTVMKQLNEDSDVGIVRPHSPQNRASPARSPGPNFREPAAQHQLLPRKQLRSDAPSPSPNRLKGTFQYLPQEPTDSESVDSTAQKARELVARNARFSPSFRPSKNSPPINRLASPGSSPPSEWNDVITSGDEDKFHSRTAFFDHRIHDVVGGIVQQRLGPLEKQLAAMNSHLENLSRRSTSRRPRSSGATVEIVNSDADDEDDETQPLERSSSRLKSPVRDRKFDLLKSTLNDLATAQRDLVPASKLAELVEAVQDLKRSTSQTSALGQQTIASEVKSILEDALGKQLRGRSEPVISSSHAAAAEKHALQIAGLESMLKVAETRADDELKARRSTEDALADNQRLLRSALQEAAQQKESAEETERSLQQYHGEQHQLLKRMASLEGSQEQLEKMASDLTDKNVALEGTLAEYRLSSDKWRTDIEDARHENKDLRRHINSLKADNEHLIQERQTLRGKFDVMQDQLHSAAREVSAEQARSHGKEEEHRTRLDMLSARLEAEARTRERLENEIERLEAQEKESMRARFQADQIQKANDHLDNLVAKLRSEGHEYQNKASRLERDLHTANETKIMEVHRIRSVMTADVEAAKAQVNNVRGDLQSVISRLEKQVEEAAVNTEKSKSRYELMLEEAAESRHTSLREAAEAREAAMQEHYRFHERTLGELKAHHQRALENATEDKSRSETHWANRLSLADEKEKHLQDRVSHLEEKLEIAKAAAHAAVQAAKASKTSPTTTAAVASITDGASPRRDLSSIPEKISPQALRESILVLQEQLQARESRIEDLEIQLSEVDREAPTKLKEADIEITWLRELLGVRIDDLEDIIKRLSQPLYDRDAVKDAAIRLKANLQMEQQEKERALAGGTTKSFPSLSNLAASPRAALPLAAAAAWGNWRKGRDSAFGSIAGIANSGANVQETPSKSSTPQSLFAGLMTPPRTDLRSTPTYQAGSRPSSSSAEGKRPLQRSAVGGPTTRRQSFGNSVRPSLSQAPVTPPLNLMRKASYDLDAREGSGFESAPHREGSDEMDGFNTGVYSGVADGEEPFGPRIGTFSN